MGITTNTDRPTCNRHEHDGRVWGPAANDGDRASQSGGVAESAVHAVTRAQSTLSGVQMELESYADMFSRLPIISAAL